MPTKTEHRKYFLLLCALFSAFCFRVIAQLLVACFHVPYLPPMDDWFSGLMPYPILLFCQILIVILYGKICRDFYYGRGFFFKANRKFGAVLLRFGLLYLGVMVVRYVVRIGLYPHERWAGGSLPIFFHWVLSAFLLTLAIYHLRFAAIGSHVRQSKRKIFAIWSGRLAICAALVLWIGWLIAPAVIARQLALRPTEFAVRVQKNIPVVMRDKITLRADVFRPEHSGRRPTVLLRLPMTKSIMNVLFEELASRIWAERGYVVVVQGTRGRFGSEGAFYPLRGEDLDGVDTLNWLARQDWYDGKILTWGGSAFGCTELAISDQKNPGPVALYAYETCTNVHQMFYPGRAFSLFSALSWAMHSHGTRDQSDWPTAAEVTKAADGLPLLDADKRATGEAIPFFRDWVHHTQVDMYWNEIDGVDRAARVAAPVLMMSGWYDPFLPAQLDDFVELQKSSHPAVAQRSRLVIGPWTHASEAVLPQGGHQQPFRATSVADGLRWFDENTQSFASSRVPDLAPRVKIFVLGKNEWRYENEWPLARAKNTPLYLHAIAKANGASANGELKFDFPTRREPNDAYVYDPRNPVPTCGGAVIGRSPGIACQDEVERRADVLNYTSQTLENEIEITGPVSAILYCATSSPCTDFTAKLVDVGPDGSAFNVCDGITRWRPTKKSPEQVKIDLWPTSIVILKGHRIRLEVSSSNFPRFDRNPNSGRPIETETLPISAQQIVCHGLNFPSRIILPIITAKKRAS